MHRLFLDANILFSAAYGSPGLLRLWELARAKKAVLLTSGYAVEEARRNLRQPAHRRRLEELLQKIVLMPEAAPDIPSLAVLPEKDRPVLLSAIQAQATHFLTGDIKHFGPYRGQIIQGVLVCTPRDYLSAAF